MVNINDMTPENAKKALLSLYTDLPAKSTKGTKGTTQAAKSHNVFLVFAKMGGEKDPTFHFVSKDRLANLQSGYQVIGRNFVENAKKLKELCAKVNETPTCVEGEEKAKLKNFAQAHNDMVDSFFGKREQIKKLFRKTIYPRDLKISFSLADDASVKGTQSKPISTPAPILMKPQSVGSLASETVTAVSDTAARVLKSSQQKDERIKSSAPPIQVSATAPVKEKDQKQLEELEELERELEDRIERHDRAEPKDEASELEKTFYKKRGDVFKGLGERLAKVREKIENSEDARKELDQLKEIGIEGIRVQLPEYVKKRMERMEANKASIIKSLASMREAASQKSHLGERHRLLAAELAALEQKNFPGQIARAVEAWAADLEDNEQGLLDISDKYDKETGNLQKAIGLYSALGLAIIHADRYLETLPGCEEYYNKKLHGEDKPAFQKKFQELQKEKIVLEKDAARLKAMSTKLLADPRLKEGKHDAVSKELGELRSQFEEAQSRVSRFKFALETAKEIRRASEEALLRTVKAADAAGQNTPLEGYWLALNDEIQKKYADYKSRVIMEATKGDTQAVSLKIGKNLLKPLHRLLVLGYDTKLKRRYDILIPPPKGVEEFCDRVTKLSTEFEGLKKSDLQSHEQSVKRKFDAFKQNLGKDLARATTDNNEVDLKEYERIIAEFEEGLSQIKTRLQQA